MSRSRVAACVLTALVACVVLPGFVSATSLAGSAPDVVHTVSLSGADVSMYPDFDPQIERYAVTTGPATNGQVTVTATTSDPQGEVRINGRLAPNGTRTITGLAAGDEISVFITDAAGTATHALFYLPEQFPELARDRSAASLDTPSPGHVLLTLGLWLSPSPFFETAVDANGVPAMVSQQRVSLDFKRLPDGHYSVARNDDGQQAEIVELDDQFREVGRYRTVGLVNTDTHDAILLPDGSRYLLAYEPSASTGLVDAVVQQVSAAGEVLFEWNSADHVDPAVETVVADEPNPATRKDYAHINSVEIMDDGDLLLSFRHLSSVFKVARTAHDGFAEGEVIWRLGGRRSDFAFVNEDGSPALGPCAQHTATELANGDIMVFDNGAWAPNPLCVDPADPDGPSVPRLPTRIAAWSVDPDAGLATNVRDQTVGDRYALFAGSAQALADGHVMIGWASSTDAVASEIDAAGTLVWDLKTVDSPAYFTYRAFKQEVPDRIAPKVSVTVPADGATYLVGAPGAAVAECTDRGGSSLRTCSTPLLDTSAPGTRTVTVSATDGAGNRTDVSRNYQVVVPPVLAATPLPTPPVPAGPPRPDAWVKLPGGEYRGQDRYGPHGQTVRSSVGPGRTVTAVVRIQNDGDRPGRFAVLEPKSSSDLDVSLRMGDGRARSPRLDPGETWAFRARILVEEDAATASRHVVRIRVRSTADHDLVDTVRVAVHVRASR